MIRCAAHQLDYLFGKLQHKSFNSPLQRVMDAGQPDQSEFGTNEAVSPSTGLAGMQGPYHVTGSFQ